MRKYVGFFILIVGIAILAYVFWGCGMRMSEKVDPCMDYKIRIELFEKAVEEFGAVTPIEAAETWIKGVKTRNGALQYATMSSELKKIYKEALDASDPNWVTGISSPWVDSYTILGTKRPSKGEYIVTMEVNLATSSGSAGKYPVKLSVINENGFWRINEVVADNGFLALTGLPLKE